MYFAGNWNLLFRVGVIMWQDAMFNEHAMNNTTLMWATALSGRKPASPSIIVSLFDFLVENQTRYAQTVVFH